MIDTQPWKSLESQLYLMHNGQGQLIETFVDSGGRIVCPPELIPAPGQYLLAHAGDSDSPLAVPVFFSESAPNGFRAAFSFPIQWGPGTMLYLRGPLGHGFGLPSTARRVVLIAFDDSPSRLRGLIPIALKAGAAVTLLCECAPEELAEEVEVQPLRSMEEICEWADYTAVDVARENLPALKHRLNGARQARSAKSPQGERSRSGNMEAQILVRTSMPCGAMAECGVCAITLKDSWTLVCKDGPVFSLSELG